MIEKLDKKLIRLAENYTINLDPWDKSLPYMSAVLIIVGLGSIILLSNLALSFIFNNISLFDNLYIRLLFNALSILNILLVILLLGNNIIKSIGVFFIVQFYFSFRPRDVYEAARNEMVEHWAMQLNKDKKEENVVKNVFNTTLFSYPVYEDLEEYIKNNWGKSRAFLNLAYRHCDMKDGVYNKSLLLWSKIVPMARLGENQRLELLKCNLLSPVYETEDVELVSNVEKLFSNYKPNEILTLFNGSYEALEYKRLLLTYTKRKEDVLPFPVFKRMNSLLDYMQLSLEADGDIYPRTQKSLEGICKLGLVERVSTLNELVQTAYEFSNCLKSYHKKCLKGKAFVYKIKGKTPIVFHVDNKGVIGESKYKANVCLSKEDEELLLNYVKSKF